MATAVEAAGNAAKRALGGWTRPQMVLAGGLAATVIVVAIAAYLLRPGRDFAPLFTGLAPADAAAVVAQLESRNEPYRLDDQGATVLVPSGDVYRLRIDLAAEGLPNQGTVGFEIMDKLGLASTNFDRQVALLRATQGELERTIDQIAGVRASRVHLVMAKEASLGEAGQPASAAVLVEMQPGAELSARSVQGIVHLVAASVPGLEPEAVTVLDQTGRVLSTANSTDEGTLLADSNLALQAKFQEDLQHRLDAFLTRIFGPGNVATQVAATLNFDRTTTVSDMFAAPGGGEEGLLRSIQELQSSMTGEVAGAGGVPGDSNFPTYPAVGGGSQNSSSTSTQSTRNYELNETKTTTQVAPGTVKQLQVSVVVNKPLTPQQEAQVQSIVAAAVGADPARNDVITVTSMPFDTSLADALAPEGGGTEAEAPAIPLWAYAAAGGGALLLVLLLIFLIVRRRSRRDEAYADLDPEELALLRSGELARHDLGGEAADEVEELLADVRGHARSRPDLVARTLRAWMAEE